MRLMGRRLFEHPVLTVEGFPVTLRGGGSAEFVRLRMPDWANVIPVTEDGELVLVRQHRWGIDAPTLEIPAGVVDPGEDPSEAALRELIEETGHSGALRSLGWVWSNPALQDNRTWLFVAEGVRPIGAPSPDDSEQIEVVRVPLADLPDLLRTGQIRHALAVVALQRFLLERAGTAGYPG